MNIEESEHNQVTIEKGAGMGKEGATIKMVPIKQIKLGRNSRMMHSKGDLYGLMQSIKESGLLQPIGLVKSGNHYEVAFGNRRFLACSKLNMHKVPSIVFGGKDLHDRDIKNLAENVQRSNVSLTEIGRYITMLKEGIDGAEPLSNKEIAVRLGVTDSYIKDALSAYGKVPDKFKDKIETGYADGKQKVPGKISVGVANKILNTKKTFALSPSQTEKLFQAATKDDRFVAANLDKYATAILNKEDDPIGAVKPVKMMRLNLPIYEEEWERLEKKYIINGQYKHMTEVFRAILSGKLSAQVKLI